MIQELILEHKSVAFVCQTIDHVRYFIHQSDKEKIVFSKRLNTVNSFVEDTDMLLDQISRLKNPPFVILTIMKSEDEIQFYSSSRYFSILSARDDIIKYKDYYTDTYWDKYKMIDFTEIIRDKSIDDILK